MLIGFFNFGFGFGGNILDFEAVYINILCQHIASGAFVICFYMGEDTRVIDGNDWTINGYAWALEIGSKAMLRQRLV